MATYRTYIKWGSVDWQEYEDMKINIELGRNNSAPTDRTTLTFRGPRSSGEIQFENDGFSFIGTLNENLPNPNGPVAFRGDLL